MSVKGAQAHRPRFKTEPYMLVDMPPGIKMKRSCVYDGNTNTVRTVPLYWYDIKSRCLCLYKGKEKKSLYWDLFAFRCYVKTVNPNNPQHTHVCVNAKGPCRPIAITGVTFAVLCHVAKFLHLFWWSGIRRCNLQVPDLDMIGIDLKWKYGGRVTALVIAARIAWPIPSRNCIHRV